MNRSRPLVICLISLITMLATFSSIGTAAGQAPPYSLYLPVMTKMLLENPPVAVDDTYSINQDTQLVVPAPGVLGNDSDKDGDSLTAVWVNDPTHGNLSLNGNGSFTYMPDNGYVGGDSFSYKASDGALLSHTATVSLTVRYVDNTPCANAPTLIAPGNGSNANSLIPTFQWDNGNVTGVTEVHFLIVEQEDDYPDTWEYWVTSYNSSFEEERYDEKNLPPATTYYWQVWLRCGDVESPHSDMWSFTTGSDGVILPAPTLISPADESDIWSEDLPVTLRWSAVTGAQEYQVGLARYDYTWSTWFYVWGRNVTGTEAVITYPLAQSTKYEWWVRPINDYALGARSVHWTFLTHQ